MPPKWRTKSGCLTCRMRRKKCDEEHDACRACRRNGLTCIWQSNALVRSDSVAKSPPTSPKAVVPHHPLSTWESPSREALFHYFASGVLPHLLIPGTPPSSREGLLAFGLEYPCIMDAFLACAALFLSSNDDHPPPEAIGYYSAAIRSTRKMIQASTLVGTEDWLFILTLLLCIYERAQSGSSCGAVSHLLGATQIMTLKVQKTRQLPSGAATPLEKTCAAALLYHTATTAFLSPDLTWLPGHTALEQVQQYIGPGFTSPFAMPPALCRLIVEISRLARRTPLDPSDEAFALYLRQQLDTWLPAPPDSDTVHVSRRSNSEVEEIRRASELYALAADILLRKVTEPQITAEDRRIQGRVKQILSSLQSDVHGLFWNQHYTWPFVIVGCAVQRETEMLFLLGRLEKLWQRSHWGDIKRTSHHLKQMLHSRIENAQFAGLRDQRVADSPEAFDLLIRRNCLVTFE